MLKTALLAAAALSFVALGASTAEAKGSRGHHGQHGHHGHHKFHKFNNFWLGYSWYPNCHYEPRKVRIKVWNGYGGYYFKSVWRDVKVCY